MRAGSKRAPFALFSPGRSCSPVTGGAEEPDLGGGSLCVDNKRTLTTAHRTDTTAEHWSSAPQEALGLVSSCSASFTAAATTAQAAGSVAFTV